MKKIKEAIEFIFAITIGIIISILLLPFTILTLPFTYYNRKETEKKYSDFLEQHNGKNFFCYNNRKRSKEFIEEGIIPSLVNNVEIVYLNGRQVESEYPKEFISNALYSLKTYNKFPHLMKIRNGN